MEDFCEYLLYISVHIEEVLILQFRVKFCVKLASAGQYFCKYIVNICVYISVYMVEVLILQFCVTGLCRAVFFKLRLPQNGSKKSSHFKPEPPIERLHKLLFKKAQTLP